MSELNCVVVINNNNYRPKYQSVALVLVFWSIAEIRAKKLVCFCALYLFLNLLEKKKNPVALPQSGFSVERDGLGVRRADACGCESLPRPRGQSRAVSPLLPRRRGVFHPRT